jgi:hypothetical protein
MLSWRDRGRLPEDMALGQRWGPLRIVGTLQTDGRTQIVTVCLCGEVVCATALILRAAPERLCPSCAPMPARLPADMARGQQWGRLTIVGYKRHQHAHQVRTLVLTVCLCGRVTTNAPTHLRKHRVVSCGCVNHETSRRRMRQVWRAVRAGERTLHVGRPRKQEAA